MSKNVLGGIVLPELKTINNLKVTSLKQFILICASGISNDEIFDLFEEHTSEEVRELIYSMSGGDTNEPFRAAMDKMGFHDF
jgi:transposase-like protein